MNRLLYINVTIIAFVSLFSYSAASQERIRVSDKSIHVSGRVISSASSNQVPGVLVTSKQAKRNTFTDEMGQFEIKAEADDTLEFSIVGYEKISVPVKGKTKIEVSLVQDRVALDEVVVIGYGTTTRRDLTGSVSSVKGEDLDDAAALTFADALRGKAAGMLAASSSGEPGSATDITIRGLNSISASNKPLYVIDGIPLESDESEVNISGAPGASSMNPLAFLDPRDIESIDILKDASAAAIYGSRGANGVIIITTKTAKKGDPFLDLGVSVGKAEYAKRMDVLGAKEYAEYMHEFHPENSRYTNRLTGELIPYTDKEGVNWQDRLLQNPVTQKYSLAISNAKEKTNYRLSLGYDDAGGLVRKSNFKRYSLLFNQNSNLTDRLQLRVRLSSGYTTLDGQIQGAGEGSAAGIISRLSTTRPVNVVPDDEDDPTHFANPADFIDKTDKLSTAFRTNFNATLAYKFAKYFSLEASAGGSIIDSKQKTYTSKDIINAQNLNGQAFLGNINTINLTSQNTLTFTKYKRGHRINALVGYTVEQRTREQNFLEVTNFAIEMSGADAIQAGSEVPTYNSGKSQSRLISYLGRVNYSYKSKYLFTGSVRADGSSKFYRGNKYSIFPAAAFSWQIGEEDFIKDLHAFDQLKLRLSYGSIGNQGIPSYQTLGTAGIVDYYSNDELVKGVMINTVPNINLKWETTTTANIGVDMVLFNDRLSGTFEVYQKDTRDLLLNAPIPINSGFELIFQNVAKVRNKGFEITIDGKIIDSKLLQWSLGFNLSRNDNRVLALGDRELIPFGRLTASQSYPNVLKVGYSSSSLYGYIVDGLYQEDDFEGNNLKEGVPSFSDAQPGSLKFKDISGPDGEPDGIIDENDLTIIGDGVPKYYGGITNTVTYRGITLSASLSFQQGNDVMNWNLFALSNRFNNNVLTEIYRNAWRPEQPDTDVMSLKAGLGVSKALSSTYYVQDASYLRLQNINLSYNVPNRLIRRLGIATMGVFASVSNIATITKYKYGYDPEVTSSSRGAGINYFNYPRPRTYTFGINIKL